MNARSQFPTPVMGDIPCEVSGHSSLISNAIRVPNARASELLDLRPDFGTSSSRRYIYMFSTVLFDVPPSP